MKTGLLSGWLCMLLTILVSVPSAQAWTALGTGDASLLGGDLTDPEDDVMDHGRWDSTGEAENSMPSGANWVTLKSSPNTPPGTTPHQRHAYHDWQNSPPCAIFLNHPAGRKWYLGFLDGGNGGPTVAAPYFCAVEMENNVSLSHFTITTSPDMPGRDPKQWALQGSMTGEDGDWTDIYKCDAADRSGTPFQEQGRCQTFLFSSFKSSNMGLRCSPADAKKIRKKLGKQKIEEADFKAQRRPYKWFRIVVYSCFNANSMTFADFNRPPGFAMGQLELFGRARGATASSAPKEPAETAPIPRPVRTWTSKKGSTIEAQFVGLRSGTVTLQKADGKPLKIRLTDLSAEDQQYLRELAAAARE